MIKGQAILVIALAPAPASNKNPAEAGPVAPRRLETDARAFDVTVVLHVFGPDLAPSGQLGIAET